VGCSLTPKSSRCHPGGPGAGIGLRQAGERDPASGLRCGRQARPV